MQLSRSRVRAAATVAAVLLVTGAVFVAAAYARSLGQTGGISGRVYVGPLDPIRHTLPGLDGDEMPYQATIAVDDEDGTQEITRVRSDEHGEFRVALAPGLYLLRPLEETQPFPLAKPMLVRVDAGAYTDTMILYDLQIH